ncbi:MAG: hypothetical protein HY556_01770 [Euryarchaeota archaeon]|nr:hypothetical protein [Euryarchaeota archaeon]
MSRGGDAKLRTLGIAGTVFGGPAFVGLSNERLAYSGLFDEVTFEMTDNGGAVLLGTYMG